MCGGYYLNRRERAAQRERESRAALAATVQQQRPTAKAIRAAIQTKKVDDWHAALAALPTAPEPVERERELVSV